MKKTSKQDLIKLSKRIVKVLKTNIDDGCNNSASKWLDFQNGNGENVGIEIEKLLIHAEYKISKYGRSFK